MKSYDYDVIVMGAGSPGVHFAGELADGGLKVAVAEHELAGGECFDERQRITAARHAVSDSD